MKQITIDGTPYQLRTRKGIQDACRRSGINASAAGEHFSRLGALVDSGTATPADEAECARLLDLVCRLVLVAPDAVQARLRDSHRVAIVREFLSTDR